MSINNDLPPNSYDELEKKEGEPKQAASAKFLLHQRMLSTMVNKGYAGLTPEARAYWNSVY
ncbi:MAG: hypothetical protein IM572_10550 [Chitinophagaceae bacterium]|nr:hypothetical protein [Chitinophagaceae bacterium]MCA6513946.1 hypothetical protein [Chitinophagaceae bacterium]